MWYLAQTTWMCQLKHETCIETCHKTCSRGFKKSTWTSLTLKLNRFNSSKSSPNAHPVPSVSKQNKACGTPEHSPKMEKLLVFPPCTPNPCTPKAPGVHVQFCTAILPDGFPLNLAWSAGWAMNLPCRPGSTVTFPSCWELQGCWDFKTKRSHQKIPS